MPPMPPIRLLPGKAPARSALLPRIGALAATLMLVLPVASALSLRAAPSAVAAVPSLSAPAGLPAGIEPLAAYVPQVACQPRYLPGTLRLGQLLTRTYPNTSFGGAYACGTDSARSEHYDGRAIDWMNSVRNPTQAAQAASVIAFLLATDAHGNKFAMARRMGLMYIIWNNRIWGAWDGTWQPYNNCASTPSPALDSACHRNHIHFSLSWNGAWGRTSFWRKLTFSGVDYGPCRPSDLNWAAYYAGFNPKQCPSYPTVGIPPHSSQAMVALETYSGATMFPGMSGGPIKAVQLAFKLPATGRYDAGTLSRVNWFRGVFHMRPTGIIDPATWRHLLAVYKPA
ncbi:MAG: peptidoglycan-binding domain-containing protein [Jatrophihabitans sp.]